MLAFISDFNLNICLIVAFLWTSNFLKIFIIGRCLDDVLCSNGSLNFNLVLSCFVCQYRGSAADILDLKLELAIFLTFKISAVFAHKMFFPIDRNNFTFERV